MKYRVTLTVRNSSGELADILYLKSGDAFSAIRNAMAAIAIDDAPWSEFVSVRIEVANETEQPAAFTKEEIERYN